MIDIVILRRNTTTQIQTPFQQQFAYLPPIELNAIGAVYVMGDVEPITWMGALREPYYGLTWWPLSPASTVTPVLMALDRRVFRGVFSGVFRGVN